MTTQPDKLFQQKLNNLERPAPHAAWERIEATLDKPNFKLRWVKIAASIIVLAVATSLLWPTEKPDNKLSVTVPTDLTKKTDPIKKNTIQLTIIPPIGTKNLAKKEAKPGDKLYKKDKRSLAANEEKKTMAIENINPQVDAIATEALAIAAVNDTQSSEISSYKKIVYTAEEVNGKFLRKKLPIEATTEEEKASGIQKLMGYAYNLKNNSNGMGDLRQKKDEILAFNFLSQEKTNKSKNQ